MVTVLPKEDNGWGRALGGVAEAATGAYVNHSDEKALQKSIASLPPNASARQILDTITNTKTYSPKAKQEALKNYLGVAEFEELKRKTQKQEEIAEKKAQKKEETDKANIESRENIADRQITSREKVANDRNEILANRAVERETQKLEKEKKEQENLDLISRVRSQPGFEDLDEVGQYRALTSAGVPLADSERESKIKASQLNRHSTEMNKSYDAQKKFIDETTNKYKSFESETKPKLKLLTKLATDEELLGPTANAFREALGIPLGSLDNPNSELFQKTSLDLLKGLPESYGNRILKVEVDNFLRTVPTLENSPQGRRMIASNLLKLGEMKEVFYNQMRRQQQYYLDENKPFPKDFEQRIFDQVKPQIDKLNDEFIKMSEIKHIPKDTIPFFSPMGEIQFVPKDREEEATQNGGKRIW